MKKFSSLVSNIEKIFPISVMIFLALVFTGYSFAFGATPELFVAKNGNDSWSGRLSEPNAEATDGPFASLERARNEVRRINQSAQDLQPVTVYVRSGVYTLNNTFVLNYLDSGTKDCPITYKAYKYEQVILTGGKQVRNFESYKGAILKSKDKDLVSKGRFVRQLFFDSMRQIPARWPNKSNEEFFNGEWTYISDIAGEGNKQQFVYKNSRKLSSWAYKENLRISIWPESNWYHDIFEVDSIAPATGIISIKGKSRYPFKKGQRFFIENSLDELDTPGEWFYDHANGALYYWPPTDIKTCTVIIPTLDKILRLNKVSYTTLQGFVIEVCDGDAVEINGGDGNSVAGCTIRHVGGYGISIAGGSRNGAIGNDIYDTGKGAIAISGGDTKTLQPANNYAENNNIHNFGQLYSALYRGCHVSGVGNRLSNNLIHDGPDTGILLYGNDHVVEYNEIYNVCQSLADTGAIYVGTGYANRGHVIRYNKIHDIYGYGLNESYLKSTGKYSYESPHMAWGIYLDNYESGVTVYGNIIYRVPLCGVIVGGGRDNHIRNNIFVGSAPSLFIGARSADGAARYKNKLADFDYLHPPYITRYPELASLSSGEPAKPANNSFERNILVYLDDDTEGLHSSARKLQAATAYCLKGFDPATNGFRHNVLWHYGLPVRIRYLPYGGKTSKVASWADWTAMGFDKGSIISDPLFVDPKNDDYRLSKDSPAFHAGFEPIPLEKIGLYKSETRASWPPPVPEIKAHKRQVETVDINALQQ
jgi:hypothetical protein